MFIWRRHSRSGNAPPAFYALLCFAFAVLAGWALVRGDWLVAAIAAGMIAVTIAGGRMMRRLIDAQRAAAVRTEGADDAE